MIFQVVVIKFLACNNNTTTCIWGFLTIIGQPCSKGWINLVNSWLKYITRRNELRKINKLLYHLPIKVKRSVLNEYTPTELKQEITCKTETVSRCKERFQFAVQRFSVCTACGTSYQRKPKQEQFILTKWRVESFFLCGVIANYISCF